MLKLIKGFDKKLKIKKKLKSRELKCTKIRKVQRYSLQLKCGVDNKICGVNIFI